MVRLKSSKSVSSSDHDSDKENKFVHWKRVSPVKMSRQQVQVDSALIKESLQSKASGIGLPEEIPSDIPEDHHTIPPEIAFDFLDLKKLSVPARRDLHDTTEPSYSIKTFEKQI
jgi:hypothetical protein